MSAAVEADFSAGEYVGQICCCSASEKFLFV